MEGHQLRYFSAVVRAGSFTRAAETLGISRPTLSQQIRVPEKQIGNPFFERPGSCIRLTMHGEALREDVLMTSARSKANLHSVFETDQLATIFGLVRSGFGLTLIPAMAASHAAGCKLLPLRRKTRRRIGYIRYLRRYP